MKNEGHRRLMAAVVKQALRDVAYPRKAGISQEERLDADDFLASPERCGPFLELVDIDPVAFCQAYQRGGIASVRAKLNLPELDCDMAGLRAALELPELG